MKDVDKNDENCQVLEPAPLDGLPEARLVRHSLLGVGQVDGQSGINAAIWACLIKYLVFK